MVSYDSQDIYQYRWHRLTSKRQRCRHERQPSAGLEPTIINLAGVSVKYIDISWLLIESNLTFATILYCTTTNESTRRLVIRIDADGNIDERRRQHDVCFFEQRLCLLLVPRAPSRAIRWEITIMYLTGFTIGRRIRTYLQSGDFRSRDLRRFMNHEQDTILYFSMYAVCSAVLITTQWNLDV